MNNDITRCTGIALDFYRDDLNLHNRFDEDYFCFPLPNDSFVTVTVGFDHSQGDIAVQLLDSLGVVIETSQTTMDVELITKTLLADSYVVRVYSPPGDINEYSLEVTAQSSCGPLAPDIYEPDSNTFCLVDLGDVLTPPGFSAAGLTIDVPTDEDYYCFDLALTSIVDIDLSYFRAYGNLDMELLDSSQNVLIVADTVSDDDTIGTTLPPGTYGVRVYGAGGDTNCYSLRVSGVPGGSPDAYEPNDDPTTCGGTLSDFGDPMGNQNVPTFQAQATIHTIFDEDFFCFTLTRDSTVLVDVAFDHVDGNLDLELLDDMQNVLAFGVSFSDDERLIRNLGPGDYGIHIFGVGSATNQYDLSVTVFEQDTLEPNDDAGSCVAASFPYNNPNPPGELTIHDAADEDWFCFDVPGPTDYDVTIDITFAHWIGDLDMDLLDSQQFAVLWSQSRDDHEQIAARLPPGTFYVRVYGFGGAMNRYDILITGAPATGGLGPDVYEPNNSPATGVCTPVPTLPFDSFVATGGQTLTVHNSADSDYFCFSVPGTGNNTLTMDLTFLHANGDLDMEFYSDPAGQFLFIGRADTGTNNEQIVAVVPGGPSYTYAVRVYGYKGDTNTYSLTIASVPGGGLAPDNWEPNDDYLAPNPQWADENAFPGGTVGGRTIHNSIDADIIQFAVSQPRSVRVDLTFIVDYGSNPINGNDLDMAILDDNANVIALAQTGDDNESIEVNVAPGTQYRIWIYGWLGAINTYDFDINDSAPLPPQPDSFEPNNDFASARQIGLPVSMADLSIHDPATDDYYKVVFQNPDTMTVYIGFTHALGDLTLELLDASQTVLDTSATLANFEEIVWDVLPGEYVIHVSSPSANNYRMDAHAAAGGGGLVPDPYELNDNLSTCFQITYPWSETNLSIDNPFDEDFFCFTTTGNGRVTVELRFIHALGDIDVTLWCLQAGSGASECVNKIIGSSSSFTDNELISEDGTRGIAIRAGDYYIQVEGAFGNTNYYEMYVWDY